MPGHGFDHLDREAGHHHGQCADHHDQNTGRVKKVSQLTGQDLDLSVHGFGDHAEDHHGNGQNGTDQISNIHSATRSPLLPGNRRRPTVSPGSGS
ncbi:hypothetical protein SDC9_201066 [bioreactor metagenome]|uniref:Uncharacterized protein n=1 Tax=bioreactor metagenome TaxID=1076179 RepID=A0A645IR73_9ZZZZ